MTLFGTLGIAASGITVHRRWMDALSDNIANVSTVTGPDDAAGAFQERFVVAQAQAYGSGEGGVRVAEGRLGSAVGRLTYSPDHPLAGTQGELAGYVRLPDMDMSTQMTSLIMAQRGYQANVSVVDRARESYNAAIQIGRG